MSDTDRIYRRLLSSPEGVHTHDLRKEGYSGNPSQRAADIEAKYGVTVQRERESRNGRPGSVYKIVGTDAGGEPSEARKRARPSVGSSDAVKRSVPSMFDADDCVDWKPR